MDTIMKNVAYKTMKNNPNIPDGFIVDHYETDDDTVEGYIVVAKEMFSQLLLNNVTLMRAHETSAKGIEPAHPNNPPRPVIANDKAIPADMNIVVARQKEMQQAVEKNKADVELFKQFMAWKASQDTGSGSDSGS
jgi:hypothetical protein